MPDTGRSVEEILRDATEKIEALIDSNGELVKAIGTIKSRQWRDRVIGAALLIVLMVAVGSIWYTQHKFSAAKTARLANCQSANEATQRQKTLWDGILSLSAKDGPPPDPKQLAAFHTLLDNVYKFRVCK